MLKGRKAYTAQSKGNYDEAQKLYEEALADGLDQPNYLLAYSVLLLRSGQYQKAKDLLVKIQKLPTIGAGNKTQLFVNYAAAVFRLGEIEKGVRLLERQHLHEPCGSIYQTLGYLYVEKFDASRTPDFDALRAEAAERRAQAEQAAREAEERGETPAPVEPEQDPEEAWKEAVDKAEAFEKEAVDYDEEDSICLDNYGQFLYRVRGDKAEAKKWFDKAIAEREGQIDTLWFLSRYDLEKGDKQAAVAKLEKALKGRFSPLNYATREKVEAELASLRQ